MSFTLSFSKRLRVGPVVGVAMILTLLHSACGPPDLLDQAKAFQSTGQFEKSLTPLRVLLADGVKSPEVDLLYGRAFEQMGKPMLSVWALRRAMEDPDFFQPAGLILASGALAAKEYNLAISVADQLIEADPEDANALIIRSMAHVGTRRAYEAAIEDSDRVLDLDPNAVKAQVARTIALLALGRVEEAGDGLSVVEEYYAVDEVNDLQASLYCSAQVSFAREKGEVDEARETLERCLEEYPDSQEVVSQALSYYDAVGEYDRSLEILKEAVKSSPENSDYRVGLVVRLDAMGRSDEATELLEELTRSENPQEASLAFFDLAGFHVDHENLPAGIEAFEKAIARSEETIPSHRFFAFADALIIAQEYERAIEIAEQMNHRPYRELVLGRVAYERGDYEEARDHFEAGMLLWPDNSVARYLSARTADRMGDFETAIDEYRYAVRIDSTATPAIFELARLYVADGQLSSALQVLRHGGNSEPVDEEAALLELEVMTRMAQGPVPIPNRLKSYENVPGFMQRHLIQMSALARESAGPETSLALLEGVDLNWAHPWNAPVLAARIEDLIALDRVPEAENLVASALRVAPGDVNFLALNGMVLEGKGASPGLVEAAFLKANQNDVEAPLALAGRARLKVAERRFEDAVALYRRAAEADPRSTLFLWSALSSMPDSFDPNEKRRILEEVLTRDPYDGDAALILAQSLASEGQVKAARWQAKRAQQFSPSPESQALLESLSSPQSPLPRQESAPN